MKKAISLQGVSLAKQLAFTALFAALCCIGTVLIVIPLPNGYFNVGDVFVLLSGWFLGPIYGTAAAAVGSGLADIFGGFAIYAPATFVIKGVDAFLAWLVWAALKKCVKKQSLDILPRAVSVVAGEAFMVLGYFLFESALYQSFATAALSLLGNTLQGVCCGVCALILIAALYPVKSVRRLFPTLGQTEQTEQEEEK